MTEAEITTIGKLIDLCRAKGVRVFKNDGFELQLGELADNTPIVPAKAAVQPDLCRCGHPEHMHTNGMCLAGCEAEKCAGPEAKPV